MNEMVLTEIIIPTILLLCTNIVTWVFARKRNKLDYETKKIENAMQSAQYYQGLVDDLSERLEQTISSLRSLEKKYREALQKNEEFFHEILRYKELVKQRENQGPVLSKNIKK